MHCVPTAYLIWCFVTSEDSSDVKSDKPLSYAQQFPMPVWPGEKIVANGKFLLNPYVLIKQNYQPMQVCPSGFGTMNVQVKGFHCSVLRPHWKGVKQWFFTSLQ